MALTDTALETARDDWRAQAACRDADVNIFFPTTDEEAEPARAICATCPVRMECLEFALSTRQEDGVWGGLTEIERRRLRRRRQAAARAARAAAA
ncbi:MAG TPA: WhiB family transcriptional regulator [Acidimicrobiales bacterium]|nr:WhiB family transcriptional regulator [Acidimicrobiales bacterium]